MEFLDKLQGTIKSAGKEVSQKAKELSETTKLKMDIKSKEELLQKKYAELGQIYYEKFKDDESQEYAQFAEIKTTLEEIEEKKKELLNVKGAIACPKCGAQLPEGVSFCSSCGEKIDMFED